MNAGCKYLCRSEVTGEWVFHYHQICISWRSHLLFLIHVFLFLFFFVFLPLLFLILSFYFFVLEIH